MENKLTRLSKNTATLRFCTPIGLFLVIFGIFSISSEKLIGILAMVAGLAVLVFGVWKTAYSFNKSKELDAALGAFPDEEFADFKQRDDVKEYYFKWDGENAKPGYLIEDADRSTIFWGKMVKNAAFGARTFEFHNHISGNIDEHVIGHVVTSSVSGEAFSTKSSFKYDGENIWTVLHERGFRIQTNIISKFPKMTYNVAQSGKPFATVETSSMYVHEEEEAEHKVAIPLGKMYYRVWTNSTDFESLFLLIFAISETNQTIVE